MSDSAVDFTVPFKTWLPFTDVWTGLPASFKFGPAYTHRERVSDLRGFRYIPSSALNLSLPPDQLLAPPNVSDGTVAFQETTQARDAFSASEDVAGIYGMFELPIVKDLVKVVSGVRTEYSYIHLTTFGDTGEKIERNINNLDPLPSVALIVSPREDMTVRFGWSETVSRPEFRELSPVFFPEPSGLRPTVGNPFLIESHITNFDLRWDWFLSAQEIVSASLFLKEIESPIESIVCPQSSNPINSFDNADSADLQGAEVEFRKNLGFVSQYLAPVTLAANGSLIDSESKDATPVSSACFGVPPVTTTGTRPLQGQAPFVVNAVIEYATPDFGSARLLYNTAGRSIDFLGAYALPNIYLEQRDQLDFVYLKEDVPIFGIPFDFKLSAENLLDARYLSTQGGEVQEKYFKGVTFTAGFTYNF